MTKIQSLLTTSRDCAGIEPFVDAESVANLLAITRREVIDRARRGELPAHPLPPGPVGRGERRKWRFRMSEIVAFMDARNPASSDMILLGSPRRQKEKSA